MGITLLAVLNKSWKQHSTKQLLYRQLLPISQTVQVEWLVKLNELSNYVVLKTPTHRHNSVD